MSHHDNRIHLKHTRVHSSPAISPIRPKSSNSVLSIPDSTTTPSRQRYPGRGQVFKVPPEYTSRQSFLPTASKSDDIQTRDPIKEDNEMLAQTLTSTTPKQARIKRTKVAHASSNSSIPSSSLTEITETKLAGMTIGNRMASMTISRPGSAASDDIQNRDPMEAYSTTQKENQPSLKRRFHDSQSNIPKAASSLRSRSAAGHHTASSNAQNGTISSRSHIAPHGTLQNHVGTGFSFNSSLPLRSGTKSALGMRSTSNTYSFTKSNNHAPSSGLLEKMLAMKSEAVEEYKTNIKKFELRIQQDSDRIDDLQKTVNDLKAQLNIAEVEKLKMEALYKDEINKAKELQRDEVMGLKEKLHQAIREKEAEAKEELVKVRLEYERKAEEKLKQVESMYKSEINSIRLSQEEKFKESEKQIKMEMQHHFDLHEKDLMKKFSNQLEQEKKRYEEAHQNHKAEMELQIQEQAEITISRQNELQRFQQQVDKLQEDNDALRRNLDFKTNEVMETTKEYTDTTKELDATKQELQALQKDVYEYKAMLDSNSSSARDVQRQLHDDLSTARREILSLQSKVQALEETTTEAQVSLVKEEALRRKLHNTIQDMKGNLRVYCRVRPLLPHEEQLAIENGAKDASIDLGFPDNDTDGQRLCMKTYSVSAMGKPITKAHNFEFDKVFGPQDPTSKVFDEVSELVQSALDGYNVCILAYGQSGSGKTYTMMEPGEGLVMKAADQIFDAREKMKRFGWEYEFTGEMLEIYNEGLKDLIKTSQSNVPMSPGPSSKLSIKHYQETRTTIVEGLTQVPLTSASQTTSLLRQSSRNRATAATCANEHSSRSHSIFIMRVHGVHVGNPEYGIAATGERREGVLNLIDLAGSERLAHSKTKGDRLKETQSINKSLSSLVDVICAKAAGSSAVGMGARNGSSTPTGRESPTKPNGNNGSFIPFRNSQLTYLLQYSLSGNSKTLMLVNVSPFKAHENETLRSLKFATMANNTKIK